VVQDSQAQGLPLYEADEIDQATVPSTEVDRVQADAVLGEEWRLTDIAGATLVLFDCTNPPTDNVLVRQALALAIDRETLAYQVFKGAYPPTTSFSPPSLNSYEPSSFLGFDPEMAREKLAEAGYPDGEGFPVLDFTHWSIWRGPLSAQALQAMWKEHLNIDVNLTPLEPQAMRDYRISRETESYNIYYALQWADIADPSTWHNSQLDPAQNVRHTRYDKPEYVQLIRDAKNETDFAKRVQMYQQAEALVNQEVPMLTLLQEAIVKVVKPYVKNLDEVTTTIGQLTRVAQPPGLDIVK
jgi:oligopeptide transport system substrate-binding protein